MRLGGRTSQPVGHYEFCQREPDECRQKSARSTPVELTRELWAKILDVNNRVNLAVIPLTDMEIWGREELWSYPGKVGDCEDYALEKRRQLIAKGWSPRALLMTVVRQQDGEGHAVLMVRTDRGDLVLDNQVGQVLVWNDTPYQFIKRQSQTDSRKWVGIDDTRIITASATR